MKNIVIKDEKIQNLINRLVWFGLAALLLIFVANCFFSPVITLNEISIRPYDLIKAKTILELNTGLYESPTVSFYVYKYFYTLFAFLAGAIAFFVLYCFISNNKKARAYYNLAMELTALFLFISMLVGINYINVYTTIDPSLKVTTSTPGFLTASLVLLAIKFAYDIIFGKKSQKDQQIKESPIALIIAFAITALTVATLFTPIYIFPGTKERLNGIDMLLGKNDVLSFLPMSKTYKSIITLFTFVVPSSFIIAIALFIVRRKLFVRYVWLHNVVGFVALLTYGLMGLNYILVYVDTQAYAMVLNYTINTYSYIPIALLALFLLGSAFTKAAFSAINVEYKVYAGGSEASAGGGGTATEGEGVSLDPIPAFSELDKNEPDYALQYRQRAKNTFDDLTLSKLVKHIIEYARQSSERLSYGDVEIKTFIAGLAASRLSILQGMSGTGKTSLPKIFMEAIDGVCELVAVESSWRDKNELLGYYNEFSKKYTPKSFTQFLYKASLNKDVPYFIVLDEMNLSRIEYYFSDFLSLMEARENNRFIKLFDVQLYPRLDDGRTRYTALRDGHTIDVPTNVWFIGTANRDESTFEISDKVYDRAQTINFDKRAPKVNTAHISEYNKKFVPYSSLKKLFDEAKELSFDAEKHSAIKKVEELLRPYKISFGNRVLKQIEDFVKTYIACSEIALSGDYDRFALEAVDCIIYSKVVRKLELKQVADLESLIDEFAALRLNKCVEFLNSLIEVA